MSQETFYVEVKSTRYSSWSSRGTYNTESVACGVADRLAEDYEAVRVVDEDGMVVYFGC